MLSTWPAKGFIRWLLADKNLRFEIGDRCITYSTLHTEMDQVLHRLDLKSDRLN